MNQPNHLKPHNSYRIDFDLKSLCVLRQDMPQILSATNTSRGVEYALQRPGIEHKLFTIRSNEILIQTWNGGTFPTFYRIASGQIWFSNHAERLLIPGEQVNLRAQMLMQRITGSSNQLSNLFADITLLDDSSVYRISNGNVVFVKSVFSEKADAAPEEAKEHLLKYFRQFVIENRRLAVLLSGGYDSRLNLALAWHAAIEKHGTTDNLLAYHEEKDLQERAIANRVANQLNIPFDCHSRLQFDAEARYISTLSDFIISAGANRDNIRRWSGYIQHIQRAHKQARIIGLAGAEPHKGKYYNRILDLDQDSPSVFLSSKKEALAAASALNIQGYHDFHGEYLRKLCISARSIYETLSSQIDFVHYHSYLVNSYGFRSKYFFEKFNIDYPQHDTQFLQEVFSLPRSAKEGFKLVTQWIQETCPAISQIDYISANTKSLKQKPSLATRFTNRLMDQIRAKSIKGFRKETIAVLPVTTNSAITSRIKALLQEDEAFLRCPIRYCETASTFNYLCTLENSLNVSFSIV